ncbi:MAG: MBL fold metallo-hydrolase [Bradymonadia bacterium]
MNSLRVTFLGSADAFNSAGRAHSCYLVEDPHGCFAVDFGPTALVQCKRLGVDPDRLDAVVMTHMHGDHVGGVPVLLVDLQYRAWRTRPFSLVGPPGGQKRLGDLRIGSYPEITRRGLRYPLQWQDLSVPGTLQMGPRKITAIRAHHEQNAVSTSLKIETAGHTLVFSGDTGWHQPLVDLARGADLFICECSSVSPQTDRHICLEELEMHRALINVKQWVLTHLNGEMRQARARVEALGAHLADDGMVIELKAT